MSVAEKVVCVTGASGFIASWLVKLLLQRGYTVKATVRDPNDAKKTHHLVSLDGAKERLHLFKAELTHEGCFDSIVDGCQGLFHVASPAFLSAADPQEEIIGPAIKGTLNVLKSCAKVGSIKRVVITSSMAAVIYTGKPLTPDAVIDETWISDPLICEETKRWYPLSKTLAEESARRFAKDNGIDLLTMHPGMVIGPLLQPALNSSSEEILNLAKGKDNFPIPTCTCVDVRDVAYAHIQAFEDPSASGRYCLVERAVPFSQVRKILYELYPTLHRKEKYEEDQKKPPQQTFKVSSEKAKSLGVSFIPLENIMSVAEKVVCVTGASGFIASWLVKLLLQRGYTVKATVRDPNDAKKTRHLVSLDGAKERLHLFKAELMDEGCFDSIVDGCHGVFHVATPVILSAADPQAEIIGPAIKGTVNVLKSCAKAGSIKRVVITSSLASVVHNGKPLTPDVVVDETWFSDPLLCEEEKRWYPLSKTLAEESAWRFAKDNGIDLLTIHPGIVFGPLLQPALNSSSELIIALAKGEFPFPFPTCNFVDVRDVALAHIQAFEDPSACGRYCLVERSAPFFEVQRMLYKLYPTLHNNENFEEDQEKPPEKTFQVSNEKAKSLGVSFIPLEVSLSDSVESLKEKGFLSI
ncbi:hypothetical protein PTKIN_Ptkin12aG0025900 [Pterospermum kingtungense]